MSSFLASGKDAAGKKAAYNKADDASASREERINRLKTELREHIRFLSDFTPLSSDWLRMAESMHQIANVAFMETSLTSTGNAKDDSIVFAQAGKKASGTLWDQDKDELAVRILLEEGKLNLVLRVLSRYCSEIQDQAAWTALQTATSAKFKSELKLVQDRCRIFEQSVGLLMKFTMTHVEALQILDCPCFITHATSVIKYHTPVAAAPGSAVAIVDQGQGLDFDKMQECLVFHCLFSICRHLEDLDEERILDLMDESKTLTVIVEYLAAAFSRQSITTLTAVTMLLQYIVASDPYQADRKRFLPVALQAKFLSLKTLFVSDLMARFGIKRTQIQSLWDEFSKLERAGVDGGHAVIVPLTVRGSSSALKPAQEQKEN